MIYFVLAFFVVLSIILGIMLYQYSQNIRKVNFFITRVVEHGSQTQIKEFSKQRALKPLFLTINQLIETNSQLTSQYNKTVIQNQKKLVLLGHDFKTPVTSILGYVELLKYKPNHDDQQKYLDIIQQRIEHLNHMIDQFFILSVLENDRYIYQIQPLKPITLLQDQLFNYFEQLNEIYEDVSVLLKDFDWRIDSDEQALTRIYGNIIKNAIDHGMGKLSVSNEEGTIIFENEINPNPTKKSTGFGLQIMEHFSKELGFSTKVEKTPTHYKITLYLK